MRSKTTICTGLLLALLVPLAACDSPQAPPAGERPSAEQTSPEKTSAPVATAEAEPKAADAAAEAKPDEAKPKEGAAEPKRRELLLDRPRTARELATTSCDLFLRNAQAALEGRKKAFEANPTSPDHRLSYAGALFANAQIYGNLGLMAKAEELATEGLKANPDHTGLLELRGDIRSTLHKFDGALADLDKAREGARGKAAIDLQIRNVKWQIGQYDGTIEAVREAVVKRPSFSTQTGAALLYMQVGDIDQARRHFAMAELLYRDTSPIPLAWLNVQRGLLAMHTGRYEEARVFFAEAVARCDAYPMAKEHLAEIEGRLGNLDRSIALYREVVQQTSDPEFIGALAEAWAEKGEAQKAKEMITFARTKNEQLLSRHPEAMYWHAADFYLGIGEDPKKGLDLLTRNVKIRPGATSYAALAAAQLDNGKLPAAKKSIERALASPIDSAELHWTAARVYKALEEKRPPKDPAASKFEAHKKKALSMNPKIADLEGEI